MTWKKNIFREYLYFRSQSQKQSNHPLITRGIVLAVEEEARIQGVSVLNLDVRETQEAAIQLYQSLGYNHYGTHPRYARVEGEWVAGLFFWKDLA